MNRHLALAAFLVLEVLDIASTWAFLAHGGTESNPFIAKAIDAWGVWGVVVMKVATAAPILGAYAWLTRKGKQALAQKTMIWSCAAMLLVVAANITTSLTLGLEPVLGLGLILALGLAMSLAGANGRPI